MALAERLQTIARRALAGSNFARNLRRLSPRSQSKRGPSGPRFTPLPGRCLALQLTLEQLDVFCNRKIGDLELLDLADGMHDRGVVAVAEALADLRQAQGRELLGEIHRDLPGPRHRTRAPGRAHLGELD